MRSGSCALTNAFCFDSIIVLCQVVGVTSREGWCHCHVSHASKRGAIVSPLIDATRFVDVRGSQWGNVSGDGCYTAG